MPAHTKSGWDAFVDNVSTGPQEAWNHYIKPAHLNFHDDTHISLPLYTSLDADQQQAIENAVHAVLECSTSFKP